jgi:hypothetical protein
MTLLTRLAAGLPLLVFGFGLKKVNDVHGGKSAIARLIFDYLSVP